MDLPASLVLKGAEICIIKTYDLIGYGPLSFQIEEAYLFSNSILKIEKQNHHLAQRSPTFLAPRTSFVEDNFSPGWRGGNGSDSNASNGGDGNGSGGNASDGEWQMKLRSLAHHSPPAVRPGS